METTTDSVLTDPRWNAFNTQGFACACGERHVGLFPIHLHHPLGWQGKDDYEVDADMRLDGTFLSANFCIIDGKFFAMRVRLPLQMRGAAPAAFMFTAWASLDRVDFEAFVEAYKSGKLDPEARARARLVNRVGGYPDSFNLMGTAFQQVDAAPPVMIVHGIQAGPNNEHPMLADQRNGIGVDKMLELFAAYGHDMRGGIPLAN